MARAIGEDWVPPAGIFLPFGNTCTCATQPDGHSLLNESAYLAKFTKRMSSICVHFWLLSDNVLTPEYPPSAVVGLP